MESAADLLNWDQLHYIFQEQSISNQSDGSSHKLTYGTCGFRGPGRQLIYIAARMAVLIAFRAAAYLTEVGHQENFSELRAGICFTASHNPPLDNGVKLIDVSGGMLPASWEKCAEIIALAPDISGVLRKLADLAVHHKLYRGVFSKIQIYCGQDSRPMGMDMFVASKAVLNCIGVGVIDCGMTTTPELHYYVYSYYEGLRNYEKKGTQEKDILHAISSPLKYEEWISKAFRNLHQLHSSRHSGRSYTIHVDCANGVGAYRMRQIARLLPSHITLNLYNTEYTMPHTLNVDCGADFVQKHCAFPSEMISAVYSQSDSQSMVPIYASMDGDADRLILLCAPENTSDSCLDRNKIMDGDRILSLFALYVTTLLNEIRRVDSEIPHRVSVVQTAYANGASTAYLRSGLSCDVKCVPTGVKHCLKAMNESDVGMYFESNGHGTIHVSDSVKTTLRHLIATSNSSDAIFASECLLYFTQLLNPACGDAIANLLAVTIALDVVCRGNIDCWMALYRDYPSLQSYIVLTSPVSIRTSWDQKKVLDPSALQESIDRAITIETERTCISEGGKNICTIPYARAFVRPSGTEPVVRIYVEASTVSAAQNIMAKVKHCVNSFKNCSS